MSSSPLLLFCFSDGCDDVINPAHHYYSSFLSVRPPPLNPNPGYYHFPTTRTRAPRSPPHLHHRHLADRRRVHHRCLTDRLPGPRPAPLQPPSGPCRTCPLLHVHLHASAIVALPSTAGSSLTTASLSTSRSSPTTSSTSPTAATEVVPTLSLVHAHIYFLASTILGLFATLNLRHQSYLRLT
jgi:hypothetical protein